MSRLGRGEFFGAVGDRLVSGGVALARLAHDQPRRLPRHTHSAPYFSLLIRGGYRETLCGHEIDYHPMTLVSHPSDTRHSDEIGPRGAVFFVIEVDPAWNVEPAVFGRQERLLALRLYSHFRRGAADELMIESAVADLLARRSPVLDSPWLKRVVDVVHDSYRQGLTVDGLAREAGVHPITLSRGFRRRFGITVGEYVNRLRVEWAARALAAPEPVSLASVAGEAGFADQSHFTRVFRMYVGTPPGETREMMMR